MTPDRVVAVVPMRAGSKRIPDKNTRILAGAPLYSHVLRELAKCPLVDEVWVATDHPGILQALRKAASPKALELPPAVTHDGASMNDALHVFIETVPADLYVQTHATNPFLTWRTMRRVIREFCELEGRDGYDSGFSVTPHRKRFYDHKLRPINHDPKAPPITNLLPPVYEENSCLYLFTRESFAATHGRIGANPAALEISGEEALDIDTWQEFRLARALVGDAA